MSADEAEGVSPGLARTPPAIPPRAKRMIVALLVVTGATGLLGTALSPYLLVEHPLLLVGLNPDSRHLVLAAGSTELWQVVAVGAPRRALNFLATYGLASLYGHLAVAWVEKRHPLLQRLVRAVEALYQRLGIWLVVLAPVYSVAGLAGSSRMPLGRYILAIIPGQIAFVAGVFLLGNTIEAWTAPILAFLADHLVASTAIAITIVALQVLYRRWRKRQRPDDAPPVSVI